MRITIDTDLQAIIVPDSYYTHVDRLNEVIVETGGTPLEHVAYIKTLFEKAYKNKIMCLSDAQKLRAPRAKRKKEE